MASHQYNIPQLYFTEKVCQRIETVWQKLLQDQEGLAAT